MVRKKRQRRGMVLLPRWPPWRKARHGLSNYVAGGASGLPTMYCRQSCNWRMRSSSCCRSLSSSLETVEQWHWSRNLLTSLVQPYCRAIRFTSLIARALGVCCNAGSCGCGSPRNACHCGVSPVPTPCWCLGFALDSTSCTLFVHFWSASCIAFPLG